MNVLSATDIENKENKVPQEINWKHEYERLQVQMEDQKRLFDALMEEQKQTFTRHINDLENEIKKLKAALKTAQEMSTSDSSNGDNVC